MCSGCMIAVIWLKRQLVMAEKETKEVENLNSMISDADMNTWGEEGNTYKCYFAVQRYHMLNTSSHEEEQSPEAKKMLEVMAQCREEIYKQLPAETPAMRPLHQIG